MKRNNSHHRLIANGALRAIAPPTLFLAIAALFFYFPPTQYGFYPECPFHRYLGILCPGCGTTRALSALLHGRLGEAFHLNAFTMLLLPVALLYGVAVWMHWLKRMPLRIHPPDVLIYSTLAAAIVFTVVRNL